MALDEDVNAQEKELLIADVERWKAQWELERAERRRISDELKALKSAAQERDETQREVIDFLERKTDTMTKTINSKVTEISELEEAIKILEENSANTEEELKQHARQQYEAYKAEITAKSSELASMKDFAERRREYEKKISDLRNELKRERKEREDKEAYLERRFVMERERMKKEMLAKIKETKTALLSMTEGQLEMTTRRTMLENQQLTIELQYQSRQSELLIKEIEQLKKDMANKRSELKMARDNQSALAKRTARLNKVCESQRAKIKHMKDAGYDDGDSRKSESVEHPTSHHKSRRDHIDDMSKHELEQRAERAEKQLRKVLHSHKECTAFVWQCLEEVRNSDALEAKQREHTLKILFERLNDYGHDLLLP